jgi:hypothetical protein
LSFRSTTAFGRPFVAHPLQYPGGRLLVAASSQAVWGRLHIARQSLPRVWQAAYRSLQRWSRLAGCISVTPAMVAFGRLFVAHHIHLAFGTPIRGREQAVCERAGTVTYRAARQTGVADPTGCRGALTRNAPFVPAQSAVRRREGATKRAHTPLSQKASPAVRPASLRELTQTWYTAREQSFLPIGTRYLPSAPAQPGIAADRCAREIVAFWTPFSVALAAAECQAVSPRNSKPGQIHVIFISATQ